GDLLPRQDHGLRRPVGMRVRARDLEEIAGRDPVDDHDIAVTGLEVEPHRAETGDVALEIAQAPLVRLAVGAPTQGRAGLDEVEAPLVELPAALGEEPAPAQVPDRDRAADGGDSSVVVA